jgi:hypothetical protein
MGAAAKAIKGMTPSQIGEYELAGSITVDGIELREGEVKVCCPYWANVFPDRICRIPSRAGSRWPAPIGQECFSTGFAEFCCIVPDPASTRARHGMATPLLVTDMRISGCQTGTEYPCSIYGCQTGTECPCSIYGCQPGTECPCSACQIGTSVSYCLLQCMPGAPGVPGMSSFALAAARFLSVLPGAPPVVLPVKDPRQNLAAVGGICFA